MKIASDVNTVNPANAAIYAAIVSLITARAVAVRQARAQTREDARRRVAYLIGPLLGHVRDLLNGPPNARVPEVPKKIDLASEEPDLIAELAKTTDDLGFWRARFVRHYAQQVFGSVEYNYLWLVRWNSLQARGESMLMKGINDSDWTAKKFAVSTSKQVGLWAECQDASRPVWKLRKLERQLGRLYACGGRPPPPRIGKRWRRFGDRMPGNWK